MQKEPSFLLFPLPRAQILLWPSWIWPLIKGRMTMDKMKLCLKSKATFGFHGYFWKAHMHLANCLNFWINLLYLWARFLDSVQPVIFCSVLKTLHIWCHLIVMCSVFQTCFRSIACMHTLPQLVEVYVQAMHTDSQHMFKHIEVKLTIFTI